MWQLLCLGEWEELIIDTSEYRERGEVSLSVIASSWCLYSKFWGKHDIQICLIVNELKTLEQMGWISWRFLFLVQEYMIQFYRDNHIMGGVTCHSLRVDPSDPSQLYVASVNGAVAHCSRHNSKTYPKAYVPDTGEFYWSVGIYLTERKRRVLEN